MMRVPSPVSVVVVVVVVLVYKEAYRTDEWWRAGVATQKIGRRAGARCDSLGSSWILGARVVVRAPQPPAKAKDAKGSGGVPSQILTSLPRTRTRTRTVGDERGPQHHHTARAGSRLDVPLPSVRPWRWAVRGGGRRHRTYVCKLAGPIRRR